MPVVVCPSCQIRLRVLDSSRPVTVRCSGCQVPFSVPPTLEAESELELPEIARPRPTPSSQAPPPIPPRSAAPPLPPPQRSAPAELAFDFDSANSKGDTSREPRR